MIKLMADLQLLKQKAQELAYQQLLERCKVDLFFLCKYVLGYDIIDEFTHGPLCAATRPVLFWKDKEKAKSIEFPSDYGRTDEQGMPNEQEKEAFFKSLEEFIPGISEAVKDKVDFDLHELLALMPRGTLKSSCITIGFTIQWFLNYSEERILLDSETWTKATNFLVETKGHFESNANVRGMFRAAWGVYPDENKKLAWSDSKIVLSSRKKARKEPSIDTAGVEVTKNGMHYDLIIFDDLHSENNTNTKDQIEKVKQHFKLAYSLLDPGCPVIVIGTRWTFDDLYQLIIDEYGEDFNFITRSARGKSGRLFYPQRLTEVVLAKFRKKQGPYLFSCQYMNDPVDSETADFKKEWFRYKNWRDVEGMPINWYLTIDPSAGGESADFAAFVISGMDYQSQVYVRYVLRKKTNYAGVVTTTIDLYRKFPEIKRIAVETLATQTSLEYTYKEKMKELNFWMPIQFINSRQKSKVERILALAPKYEFASIFHIRDCPQITDLEDELLKFPKAPNDDASDALATVLEIAHPPMRGAANPERRSKRKAYLKKLNAPRSPMIGY